MKRLNVKLLLILAITFVVLTAGVVVVHGIQMSWNTDSLIKQAENAKSNNSPRAAAKLYFRYLQYNPDDLDRTADYAMCLAEVAQLPDAQPREFVFALRTLEEVMHKMEQRADLRRKLIELSMFARQYTMAKDHLSKLKAQGQGDAKADLQLAQCLMSTAGWSDARQLLESLIGYDAESKSFDPAKATAPKEIEAYSMLATVLRERLSDAEEPDRIELADRVIDQLVKVNDASPEALLVQAAYAGRFQSDEKSAAAVERAMKLAPENADVLLQAALIAIDAKDLSQADAHLSKGLELHPKDERFYRASVMLASQNNPEQAQRRLEAGLKALPDSPGLLELQFNRQLQDRNFEAARVTLKLLGNTRYPPVSREFLEARLMMGESNYQEASQRLETLRPRLGAVTAWLRQTDLYLMECYTQLGLHDKALKAADRVRDTAAGQIGMAAALQALGKMDEALKAYNLGAKALEQGDQMSVVPQLPTAILQASIANEMRKPKTARNWSGVEAQLEKMRQQNSIKEPTASLVQAEILNRKGDIVSARRLLTDLRQKYPLDVAVIATSAGMELQDRKSEEALRILDAAPENLRQSQLLMAVRIEALLLSGTPDIVKPALAATARQIESLPKDDQAKIYPTLGMAYLRLGDREAAKQQWTKAAELRPRDARMRLALFDLARDSGDIAAMKQLLAWFEKEPSSDIGQRKLLEAAVLVSTVREAARSRQAQSQPVLDESDKGNLLKARNLLDEVASTRPDWSEQPKLLSEIDLLEGRTDDAISHLRTALRLGQPSPDVIQKLIALLHLRQRNEEAEELIDTYGSVGEAIPGINVAVKTLVGDPGEALVQVEATYSRDSKNAFDHLRYGHLLSRAARHNDAEAAFRRAAEVSPDAPDAWLALISELMTNKKGEEALRTLQDAQIALPEDRRPLMLAQGYEILGSQTQAEQAYLAALAGAPNDLTVQRFVAAHYLRTNRPEQAKKHLNEILRSKPATAADKDTLAWSRRMSAQLLAADGSYQKLQQALELLSPPGERPAPEDLSIRISMLSQRSEPASTRQALRLLDELEKLRPLAWQERLNSAILNDRIDNWPVAREEMLALLTQPKPDPMVYLTFAEMLLRHGAPQEAIQWLDKLEQSTKQQSLRMAGVTARALAVQGRGSQAAAMLLRLVPAERPVPKDRLQMVSIVAGYLDQIDQLEAAEKLLRETAGNEPQQAMELAALLARRGKVDAALDLVERHRRSFPAAPALAVAIIALRNAPSPLAPAQVQRVEQWFESVLRDDPEATQVQLVLADLREFQGRTQDAEKLYREILRRPETSDADRAVVMNNLAFMLAMEGRNRDEALQLVNEAVRLFGPQSDILDTRGVIHLIRGETRQALEDLSDAVITPDPKAIKFVHLAMAQAAVKDEAAARKSLDKAKEMKFDPNTLSPLEKAKYEALLKQLNVAA